MTGNGWDEWKIYVLEAIKRAEKCVCDITDQHNDIEKQIATLEIRVKIILWVSSVLFSAIVATLIKLVIGGG